MGSAFQCRGELSNGGLGVRPDYHPLLLKKWGRVNYYVVQALQGRFTLPQPSSQKFEKTREVG